MGLMETILQSVEDAVVVHDPFTCIVFEEFINDETSRILTETMPEHTPFYHANNILNNEPNALWKEYIACLNNPLFQIALLKRLGSPTEPMLHEVGLRGRDIHTKFVTESYMAVRDPDPTKRTQGSPPDATYDSWLLYPHLDSHYAITSMVHMHKKEDDTDDSGSLCILKRKHDEIRYIKTGSILPYAEPDDFDVVHEFPYKRNFAAGMLCGPEQWHGVMPRYKNIRRTVNMSIEWQNKGFRKKHQIDDEIPYSHQSH